MGKACQQEDKGIYFHTNIIGMPLKCLWHRVITIKLCNNKTNLYVNISKKSTVKCLSRKKFLATFVDKNSINHDCFTSLVGV